MFAGQGTAMLEENTHLYNLHEFHKASVAPLRMAAQFSKELHSNPMSPLSYTPFSRHMAAGMELVERLTRRYHKPEFGITETEIDGKTYKVTEKIILEKTWCSLLNFSRAPGRKDPKLLIVAPMSGHYATLLRGTVEGLLPYFDVYITDWTDAREIPIYKENFDLDDFIDYVTEFVNLLGSDTHVMAVCQPSVPVLAAISLMASAKSQIQAKSMILVGGPIDTRLNPTEVNRTATDQPIEWFRRHVITRVPFNYPGFMRLVYPGFMQLTGFMTMNLERHVGEHLKLFNHLIEGDGDSVEAHKKFYNEYLAVMDLPAEFYLQTVETVFKDHSLPRNKMVSRGRVVDPSAITKTGLLTLEGELDDISGVGQTKAAHKLCKGLSENKKRHHLQKGVGHYGIFNGRKFKELVVPVIVEFTHKLEGRKVPTWRPKFEEPEKKTEETDAFKVDPKLKTSKGHLRAVSAKTTGVKKAVKAKAKKTAKKPSKPLKIKKSGVKKLAKNKSAVKNTTNAKGKKRVSSKASAMSLRKKSAKAPAKKPLKNKKK